MPKSENQKIKLLRLYEYLLRESDEKNPKSMHQIISYLQRDGITCERKSIYTDVEIINKYYKGKDGGGIIRGREAGKYYVSAVDRQIGYDKIRFLLDAVQSAAFLTKEQTDELSYAIKNLAGSRQQDNWDENVIILNKTKHTNEQVFRSVGAIDEAISDEKKILFKYFDLDLSGKPVPRKNGDYYTESPISLIFNNGFYYMIAFNEKYNGTVTYRVDRMKDVIISEEDSNVSKQKKYFSDGENKHSLTAFSMWHSERTAQVTLLVENYLTGDIFDKFGMDCRLKPCDDDHFTLNVKVPLNGQFYGWVMSFGTQMQILSPENARHEIAERLEKTLIKYK